LSSVVTFWWLGFFTCVGLSLGSFLNVVIYRLPAGLAVGRPTWSFCPACRTRIAWYDNLPVLSYLLLKGRCRTCTARISPRYPVVELLAAIVVITLFDAFFIHHSRPGLQPAADLTWRIWDDWPVFIAHVVLLTSLLAMSAIDLQFYWVDIRFTHLAALCGLLLHTLWTPLHSREWYRPSDPTLLITAAAFIAFAVVYLLLPGEPEHDECEHDESTCECEGADHESSCECEGSDDEPSRDPERDQGGSVKGADNQPSRDPASDQDGSPERAQKTNETDQPDDARVSDDASQAPFEAKGHTTSLVLLLIIFCFVWISVAAAALDTDWSISFAIRSALPLLAAFVIIVAEASQTRDADGAIAEAIEFEAPSARGQTLWELATLTPAIVLGGLTFWFVCRAGFGEAALLRALHWRPTGGAWQPIWGLSSAISGYIIAAAIGWTIRILANLIYGREAFATGDIHMMAAAGAVTGWPIVLLGFMITCLSALLAWVVLLPLKRGRVIPLGPWLTMGFWAGTLFFDRLIELPFVQRFVVAAEVLFFNNSQP